MGTYIVIENRDGTVTIDRKVYEELHHKASKYEETVVLLQEVIKTFIANK